MPLPIGAVSKALKGNNGYAEIETIARMPAGTFGSVAVKAKCMQCFKVRAEIVTI